MRKRTIKSETVLGMLRYLHSMLEEGPMSFKMGEFLQAEPDRLDPAFGSLMIAGGLISKAGGPKHGYTYTWTSIKPNIHMAEKLLESYYTKKRSDQNKIREEKKASEELSNMSESDKTFTFFEDVALKDIRTDVTPSQILIWAAMNTDENGSIKLSELRKALLK